MKKNGSVQNTIDLESFSKYFEHVKDILKHFFTIVAAILGFSITLSGSTGGMDKMTVISKIMLIIGWGILFMALILAAYAINDLFVAYERVMGFDYYGRVVEDPKRLIARVSTMCSLCVVLFMLGMVALGTAAIFGFW